MDLSADLDNNEEEFQAPPRKRPKRESLREKSKKLRNLGLNYLNRKKQQKQGKQFEDLDCKCTNKCFEKISTDSRKLVFEMFWKIGSLTEQNVFLCGLVQQYSPNQQKNPLNPKKTQSNYYYLKIGGYNVKVCKTYFLKTFQISNGRLSRALAKLKSNNPIGDNRGRHVPSNKTSDEAMKTIRDHILSFPSYESHYTRHKNPNRKYLSTHLNLQIMYRLYKEHCTKIEQQPVGESVYRKTFYEEFNLHFHKPVKDTCARCDNFKAKITACENEEEKNKLKSEHDFHLRKAEEARSNLQMDAKISQTDQSVYTFTFDLEKALAFPLLTTSLAYYKRNMYVYNFGCHGFKESGTCMYVWDETIASRGSQEVGSCVIKHLKMHASNVKQIIMYSDTCTGQNRNLKFVLFLLQFLGSDTNTVETIDHKFMVSGHSYLPNDADFGSVETYAKKKEIYVAQDWYKIIANCRKKNPFQVTQISQDDVKSVANLEKSITRRKKNTDEQPVLWLKMQWIRLLREHPYSIFYKETLDQNAPFSELNIRSSKVGRPLSLDRLPKKNLYDGPRPVTKEKKNDMLELLPFIPPIHHNYFINLKSNNESNKTDDIGPLDFFETD